MYKHILISTDGSDVAQKGVDHGLSLAKALGAKVTIITVTERFPIRADVVGMGWVPGPNEMADYAAGQQKWAEGVLARANDLRPARNALQPGQMLKLEQCEDL